MSIPRNNSIWYKFLAVLLVVALLFTFVLPRPEAKAIALADDAVLLAGAGVAVLIAAGIYFTSHNTDSDSFANFIAGKIDNFIASEGTGSVSDYASGISLNPNGVGLNVTDPTMRFLDRFLNWFKAEENLTDINKTLVSYDVFNGVTYSTDKSNPTIITTISTHRTSFVINGVTLYCGYLSSSDKNYITAYDNVYSNKFSPTYNLVGAYTVWLNSSSGPIQYLRVIAGDGSSWTNVLYEWTEAYVEGSASSISASYTANPAYSVSDTQSGTVPFIIVIDETSAGGSGGNNNKHDTARDAAISALQLGLAGKLLSSVTQSSSDPGQEGGDSNVSSDVSGIRAAVNSIKNWLDTGFKTFSEVCIQFFTDVRLFFADFWTNFTTKLKEVFNTSLEAIQELLSNIKAGISSAAEAIKTAVSTAADTIGGKIDSIGTKISDWWEEWRSSKNDKPTFFFGSGFNSIWHYVVEWLSYIGGFLSLVLNVWSVLPYGMVVPVYAAVVLILYFGIYRKFIK